ncbi:PRC-barrel domain-containing protein [Micromonospora thermarum]|uniref:PRC-barrel domain containing protein n=1 Tax=Micromonospora thermarum TaxID=2720024 RepID=A0ABX0Z101_9ACTN|nr:PRC-barrel domain-containing protein [Micromonospora thermarum]NJP30873.1 PRC-barrel domain containing protein [Micromonospora thermarum]
MERLDPRTTHGTPDPLVAGGQDAFPGTPGGTFDPWRYREDAGVTGADLVGYKVEATDGSIGKVDRASHEVNSSYLVVDTGPWIFGKKVMIPAGTVNHVDHDERKVYVDRSKDQIKAAPEFDETADTDPAYRDKLGGYYGDTYSAIPPGTAR